MREVLLPGIWYGEVSQLSLNELKNNLLSIQDERECILLIVEIMKKGDFSVKNLLIELMNQTEDEAVLNLCIRLFCSVCTNDDLKDVNNFLFLILYRNLELLHSLLVQSKQCHIKLFPIF